MRGKSRVRLANICYANVLGEFAYFSNPKHRGDNFSWSWFVQRCGDHSSVWLMMQGFPDYDDPKIKELAKIFSLEIAQRCVDYYDGAV